MDITQEIKYVIKSLDEADSTVFYNADLITSVDGVEKNRKPYYSKDKMLDLNLFLAVHNFIKERE